MKWSSTVSSISSPSPSTASSTSSPSPSSITTASVSPRASTPMVSTPVSSTRRTEPTLPRLLLVLQWLLPLTVPPLPLPGFLDRTRTTPPQLRLPLTPTSTTPTTSSSRHKRPCPHLLSRIPLYRTSRFVHDAFASTLQIHLLLIAYSSLTLPLPLHYLIYSLVSRNLILIVANNAIPTTCLYLLSSSLPLAVLPLQEKAPLALLFASLRASFFRRLSLGPRVLPSTQVHSLRNSSFHFQLCEIKT